MKRQDDVFSREKEGDKWFLRNAGRLLGKTTTVLSRYLSRLSLKTKRVLEVGCSNGHVLSPLSKRGAKAWGIDPSQKAIKAGRKEFPALHLALGVSHDLSRFREDFFDVVIISFVFHWIDRAVLLQTVSEIDRVLKVGGILIIQDFDPDKPHKIRYKHRLDRRVYTFKQSYAEIFLASNCYSRLESIRFQHGNLKAARPTLRKGSDSCALTVLRKAGNRNYPERALATHR